MHTVIEEESKEAKASSVDMNFICLSRKVIVDLCESHPNMSYKGEVFRSILGTETGFEHLSADERLAQKLSHLGYTPWVSLHSKVKGFYFSKIDSDFESFLLKNQGLQ
jgi:hypothetical protein